MEEGPLTKVHEKKINLLIIECRNVLAAMDQLRRDLDEAQISLFRDYPAMGKSLDYEGLQKIRTLNNSAYEVLGVHPFSPLTDFRPVEK